MNVTFIYVYGWMHISIPVNLPTFSFHAFHACPKQCINIPDLGMLAVWDRLSIIGGTFIKLHVFSARMIWTGQHLKTSYYILVYNVWPTSNRYFNVTRKCIRISNSSSDIIPNRFSILILRVSKKDKWIYFLQIFIYKKLLSNLSLKYEMPLKCL